MPDSPSRPTDAPKIPAFGLRPLPPYEPPCADAAHTVREAPGQLVLDLPLRGARGRLDPEPPAPPAAPRPAPPRPADLLRLIGAVIELAAGRRSVTGMRAVLTDDAHAEILAGRAAELAQGYTLRRVRVCAPAAHVLEICATAQDHRRQRAAAVAARLESRHGAWRFTRFCVLAPPRGTGRSGLSAA